MLDSGSLRPNQSTLSILPVCLTLSILMVVSCLVEIEINGNEILFWSIKQEIKKELVSRIGFSSIPPVRTKEKVLLTARDAEQDILSTGDPTLGCALD